MTGPLLALVGYLAGSVPVGLLVGRAYGVDIRTRGSGNIGTANVLRTLGTSAGVLTLVGDLLKGFLPVYAARLLLVGERWEVGVAAAALVGASYSVFLGFKGGKGVATALGVLAALAWPLALLGVLVYAPVVALTRISSVGSLAAAAALPVVAWFLYPPDVFPGRFHLIVVASLLVFWRHRENVRRIVTGTERKLDQKTP